MIQEKEIFSTSVKVFFAVSIISLNILTSILFGFNLHYFEPKEAWLAQGEHEAKENLLLAILFIVIINVCVILNSLYNYRKTLKKEKGGLKRNVF